MNKEKNNSSNVTNGVIPLPKLKKKGATPARPAKKDNKKNNK